MKPISIVAILVLTLNPLFGQQTPSFLSDSNPSFEKRLLFDGTDSTECWVIYGNNEAFDKIFYHVNDDLAIELMESTQIESGNIFMLRIINDMYCIFYIDNYIKEKSRIIFFAEKS